QRPDQRKLVGKLRLQRKLFADVHAGDVGCNWLVDAAVFFRSIRFQVVRLKLRWAAVQIEENDRRLGPRVHGQRTGLKQIGQSQPADGQAPELQELSPPDRTGTQSVIHS